MSALAREYDIINSDGESERSPPKLELIAQHYREYIKQASLSPPIRRTLPTPPLTPPLPISAMDISSDRFQPVPVKAQAVITSTHDHPRPIWPVAPKVNNSDRHCRPIGFYNTLIITCDINLHSNWDN